MLVVNSAAVQAAMLDKGFGVKKLALISKLPSKTISVLHRQDKQVRIPTLSRLAKALQVEPMELVVQ